MQVENRVGNTKTILIQKKIHFIVFLSVAVYSFRITGCKLITQIINIKRLTTLNLIDKPVYRFFAFIKI